MSKKEYRLKVDSERCILCAGCVDVCPYGCLRIIPLDQIESDKALIDLSHIKQGAALILDEAFCIHCGLCVHRCPTGAIGLGHFEILTPVYY
jgi:formate dehydrogenase major subunit